MLFRFFCCWTCIEIDVNVQNGVSENVDFATSRHPKFSYLGAVNRLPSWHRKETDINVQSKVSRNVDFATATSHTKSEKTNEKLCSHSQNLFWRIGMSWLFKTFCKQKLIGWVKLCSSQNIDFRTERRENDLHIFLILLPILLHWFFFWVEKLIFVNRKNFKKNFPAL